jgi:RHS repeat-associated protein
MNDQPNDLQILGGTPLFDQSACYNGATPSCDGAAITAQPTKITTLSSYNGGSQLGTSNVYDASGMLTASTLSSGGSTLESLGNSYNTLEELTSSGLEDGSGTTFAYSYYGYDETTPTATSGIPQHGAGAATRGNQTSAHTSGGATYLTTTTTYYDTGAPIATTTPNGTTQYSYDPTQTFATTTTLPTPSSGVQLATSASYDPQSGAMISATGMNPGQTAQVTQYDPLLRPTAVTLPNGSQVNYAYATPDQTTVTQSMGNGSNAESITDLDAYGRTSRTAVYNGQSSNSWYIVDTCYDSTGLVRFQSTKYQGDALNGAIECSGNGTSYVYDALGRMTSSTNPDGTTMYQYSGRAVKTTDVNGAQRITQYDLLGRMSVVCEISSNSTMPGSGSPVACGTDIAGTGFQTVYSYTLASNTTTVTQGAQTRTFQTDPAGRTILTMEPERGATNYSYTYNTTGLQVTRTRPQANQTNASVLTTTTTQYDSLGRPVTISYSDGITPNMGYVYDAACCWTNASSATNTKGKLVVAHSLSTAANHTSIMFSYDLMGNVTNMWQCAPSTCPTSSSQLSRPALSFSYDGAGNLTGESDGASGLITYGRSPAGEVTSITNQSYTGTYNPANLISNVVNGAYGPVSYLFGNGLSQAYVYDSLGRLQGGWVCAGTPTPGCSGQSYGFYKNSKGSQVTSSDDNVMGQNISYGYDEFNRLTSVSSAGTQTFGYTYDRYGNRTAQSAPQGGPAPSYTINTANNQIQQFSYDAAGNVTNDGFHSYTYDAEGNVLNVDGGSTAVYVYDALNRRVSAQTSSSTQEYLYDYAGRRTSIWNTANNSGIEGRIYWDGRQIAFRSYDGTTYFDHQDWLGTERVRTNYAGSTAATYGSLSWGDGYNSSGSQTPPYANQDSLHYAQLDHDAESNTDHAAFRQYSSTQGRWMSPDPYDGSYHPGNPQSFNRYGYSGNKPLSFADPSGQDQDACDDPNCADGDGGSGGDGDDGGDDFGNGVDSSGNPPPGVIGFMNGLVSLPPPPPLSVMSVAAIFQWVTPPAIPTNSGGTTSGGGGGGGAPKNQKGFPNGQVQAISKPCAVLANAVGTSGNWAKMDAKVVAGIGTYVLLTPQGKLGAPIAAEVASVFAATAAVEQLFNWVGGAAYSGAGCPASSSSTIP